MLSRYQPRVEILEDRAVPSVCTGLDPSVLAALCFGAAEPGGPAGPQAPSGRPPQGSLTLAVVTDADAGLVRTTLPGVTPLIPMPPSPLGPYSVVVYALETAVSVLPKVVQGAPR